MANKFAAALKSTREAESATATAEVPARPANPHARPSRKAAKHVGGYFDPAVSKQLRGIALEEDSSVQALLGEALDLLFQHRRKPMIASRSKSR